MDFILAGKCSDREAVTFFQASGLPKPVLAQDHVVGGLISVRFRSDLLCYRLGCTKRLIHAASVFAFFTDTLFEAVATYKKNRIQW
ncbi:hypothetical protein Hanom_Chr12g01094461 [Helianthus anomalus]